MSGRGRGRNRAGRGRRQRLPGVCRQYTHPKGCGQEDSCNFLHICRNLFNDDGCRFGRRCRYSHNFTDDQPSSILEKHKIDPNEDFEQLIALLQSRVHAQFAPKKDNQNEEEDDNGSVHDDEDQRNYGQEDSRRYEASSDGLGPGLRFQDYRDGDIQEGCNDDGADDDETCSISSVPSATSQKSNKRRNRRRNRRRKPRDRKPSIATSDAGLSEASEDQSDSENKEICIFHVKGHCTNGDNCTRLHPPSRLPYQWQVKTGSQWYHFDEEHNRSIEASFCIPSVNEMIVKLGDVNYVIEFDTMSMVKASRVIDYQEIRRLSTLPSAKNQIKNRQPYCTHWIWYWDFGDLEEDLRTWQEYSKESPPNQHSKTDSIALERAYQDYLKRPSKQTHQLSSPEYFIDFEEMTQSIPGQASLHIRRRPKPYVPVSNDKFKSDKEATTRAEKKSVPGSKRANLSADKIKPADEKTNKMVQKSHETPAKSSSSSSANAKSSKTSNISEDKRKTIPIKQTKTTQPQQSIEMPQNTVATRSNNTPVSKTNQTSAKPKQMKSAISTEQTERHNDLLKPQNVATPNSLKPLLAAQQQESVASPRCLWSDEEAHEICIAHLRGQCKYGNGCNRLHGKLPFQWQYMSYTGWKNVSDEKNKQIEKLFSAPANTGFSTLSLFEGVQLFEAMTVTNECMKSEVVRRLSTRSTATCNSSYLEPYCIEWQWYWEEEFNSWIQYAQKNSKDGMQSQVNGNDLEVAYEDYLRGFSSIFSFETQKNQYHLNFITMIQKNLVYQTERAVQRRPKFVTMVERRQLVSQLQQQEKTLGTKNVPKTWNVRGMLLDEPKLIPLDISLHGEEYMKVADMFWDTMDDKNGTIFAIKRVQNVDLWEDYAIKKERMSKKIKGSVGEKQLWHGTGKESSEAIWKQNFDFRISGSNVGTLYGQGSYFASNANYSDKYSKPEGHLRRMFLVRVLVGSFVKGVQEYKRPPLKDPNEPSGDLHDSCVDNELNPSIYVVFDKSQVYPEYLIEYKRSSDEGSPTKMPTHSVPKASSHSSMTTSANTARVSTSTTSPRSYPHGAPSSSPPSRQSTFSNYTRNTGASAYPNSKTSRNSYDPFGLPTQTSYASSSIRTPNASTSNLRSSSPGFIMGPANPRPPNWSDDDYNSSYSGRRASEGARPINSSKNDKKSCCIQ